ncbi:MAG: hypothetical protein MUC80_00425 [Candidatus Thermoplasmatota archaeon]|jgi:hypothetical protein|nr:hypothetical protein [Candidatus Thermoplasmatota archaeon]
MYEWLQYGGLILLGAILYAIGYEVTKIFIDYLKEKSSSVKTTGKINLSADDWYAVWQTTVEGKQVINTEVLKIKQRGDKIKIENREKSPENKLGGFLWMSKCKLIMSTC